LLERKHDLMGALEYVGCKKGDLSLIGKPKSRKCIDKNEKKKRN